MSARTLLEKQPPDEVFERGFHHDHDRLKLYLGVLPPPAQEITPGLLGPAQLFDPTIAGVMDLLGPAQLFTPTIVYAQSVSPNLLGGAVIFEPLVAETLEMPPAQMGVGGAIQDRLVARTHIWYQDQSGQSPFTITVPELAVAPGLLGPAQLFDPRIDQEARPGLLGPAVLFAPRIDQQVVIPLLGPAVIFIPSIGPPHVHPDLLGPAVLFAPRIDQQVVIGLLGPAQLFDPIIGIAAVEPPLIGPGQIFTPTITVVVFPDVLGPAVLFTPTIGGSQVVGPMALLGPGAIYSPVGVSHFASFTADAVIDLSIRQTHNRFTEHDGTDLDIDHLLSATIAHYLGGLPLDEMLREIDRRLTIVETGATQFMRHFSMVTSDAIIQNTATGSFMADAIIGTGSMFLGPVGQIFTPTVTDDLSGVGPMPLIGGAVIYRPSIKIGDVNPPLLGPADIKPPTIIFE